MEHHNKLALPNRGSWEVDPLTYIGLTENGVLRDFMTLIDREAQEYGQTGMVDFESVYPRFLQKIIRLFVLTQSKRLSERPLGQIAVPFFTPDLQHCEAILSDFEVHVVPIAGKRRPSTIGVRSCSFHMRKKAVKETITCGVDLERRLIVEAHEKTQHMLTLTEHERTAFQKTVGAQLMKRVRDKLKAWAESLSLGTMDAFLNYLVAHNPTLSATLVLQHCCQARLYAGGRSEPHRRMDILNKYIKNVEMFSFAVNKFPQNFLIHLNETKNSLPTPCSDAASDANDIHTDGGAVDSLALCGPWTRSRLQKAATAFGADALVRTVTIRTSPKALVNTQEDYLHNTTSLNVIATDLTSSGGTAAGGGGVSTMTNSNVKVIYEPPVGPATATGRYWTLNAGTTVVDDTSDIYKTATLELKSNPLINEFEADFYTVLGHIGPSAEAKRVFKGLHSSSHNKEDLCSPPMSIGQYDHMGAVNYVDFAEAAEFFVKRALPWVRANVRLSANKEPRLHAAYKSLNARSSSEASKSRLQMDENNYARPRHHRELALELHPFFDYSVSHDGKGDVVLTAEPRLVLGNVPPYLCPPRVHILRGRQLFARYMEDEEQGHVLKSAQELFGLLQDSVYKSPDAELALLGPTNPDEKKDGQPDPLKAYEDKCAEKKLFPYPFFFDWLKSHHRGLDAQFERLCKLLDALGRTLTGLATGVPIKHHRHIHPALDKNCYTVGMINKFACVRGFLFEYVLVPAIWGTTLKPTGVKQPAGISKGTAEFAYPHVVGDPCKRLVHESLDLFPRVVYVPVWHHPPNNKKGTADGKAFFDARFRMDASDVSEEERKGLQLFNGNFYLALKALHEEPGVCARDLLAALLSMTLFNNPLTWWLGKDHVHPGVALTLVKRERFVTEDLLLCKKHGELMFFDNPHMRKEQTPPGNATRIESDADFTLGFMKNSLSPTGFNAVAASLVDPLTDMGLALETMSDPKYFHPSLIKKTVALSTSNDCHKLISELLQRDANSQSSSNQGYAQGKRRTRAAIVLTPACANLRNFSQPGNPRGRSSCYSNCCPELEPEAAMWDHSVADPGSTSGDSTFNPWASQKYSFSHELYRGQFSNESCPLTEVSHYFDPPPVYKRGGLLDNLESDYRYNADVGSARSVAEEQRTSVAAQLRDRKPSETLGVAFTRMSFTDDLVERDFQELVKNDYGRGCNRFQCVYKNHSYIIPGGGLLGRLDHGADFAPSALNYLNR